VFASGNCQQYDQGGKPRSFAASASSHFTSSFESLPEPKVREQTSLLPKLGYLRKKANEAFPGKTLRRELRWVPRAAHQPRNPK
jgi:hypothetical protein